MDEGKRLELFEFALDIAYPSGAKWGGGLGEGGQNIPPGGRLTDDGKRLELFEFALDVAYTAGGKIGRGFGGGWARDRPRSEGWRISKMMKTVVFLRFFVV